MEDYNITPCLDVYPPQDFNKNESKKLKAIFIKDNIWDDGENGTITITFGENACCDECGNGVTNLSKIGSDSKFYFPSMVITTLDAPWESFEFEGVTYPFELFENSKRNSCIDGLINSCAPNWKPGGTPLHEFGHAMGMLHEHQNNVNQDNPFVFNRPVVLDDLMDPSKGLTVDFIDNNVINRYECTESNCPYLGSPFDPNSIMNYFIPQKWLKEGTQMDNSYELSNLDKEWLERTYPLNNPDKPNITVQFTDGEEWQRAWIQKVVTEKLQPHVGINFTFKKELLEPEPGALCPTDILIKLPPEVILGILLGVAVFIVIIIFFITPEGDKYKKDIYLK